MKVPFFPVGLPKTLLVFTLCAVICSIVVIPLAVCNKNDDCGRSSWRKEVWGDYEPPVVFCENTEQTEPFLLQKANTLSNFGYIYFGLVITVFFALDVSADPDSGRCRNFITAYKGSSLVYGASMFYLGFGSYIFHSHMNDLTYAHDQASIFVHFVIMCCFSAMMYVPLDSLYVKQWMIGISTVGFIITVVLIQQNLSRNISVDSAKTVYYILIAYLGASLLANISYRKYRNENVISREMFFFGITSLISFVAALMVQEQFVHVPCHPENFFQYHALWHVLTAIGFFLLYMFFRADNISDPEVEKRDIPKQKPDIVDV